MRTSISLLGILLLVGGRSPAAQEAAFQVFPDQRKQIIRGIGFEIQSDSIGSGNHGLPDTRVAVPHDLTPSERQRLADQMLKGFRYCRLAGGLYWRGLDPERKFLRPRWPEQLDELRELLGRAGVEGVCLEYWSPAPFWKGNQSYVGAVSRDPRNRLRCFAPGFADDPIYRGDTDQFLADFAQAVATDLRTLRTAGLNPVMFGLQNEPDVNHSIYSTCEYPDSASYVKAFVAVAGAVRKLDPTILLFADTEGGFPKKIGPGMRQPEVAALVDAYAVHTVGAPSESVRNVHARITKELPARPWFQNEYEYLTGGATRERCLNTVQHIMNSLQLAANPTWFWIHALKPFKNAEAGGYSLGFWKSLEETSPTVSSARIRRWTDGPEFTRLPRNLESLEVIVASRGQRAQPGIAYSFSVNQPVKVHLLVQDAGEIEPGTGWQKTADTAAWAGGRDVVYVRTFPAGTVNIPAHTGKEGGYYGGPHLAFVEPSNPATFKAQIGMNVPIQIRSEALALERKAADIKPGHWIYNPYNWHAVGSFVKRMPWDCVALKIEEASYNKDARIFAFQKPNGKRTIVVSNRTGSAYSFNIETGLSEATWRGYRYTPDDAGESTLGVPVGERRGARLHPVLPHLSWEFWEEQ